MLEFEMSTEAACLAYNTQVPEGSFRKQLKHVPTVKMDLVDYTGTRKRKFANVLVAGRVFWADIKTGCLFDLITGKGLTHPGYISFGYK